MVSPNFPLLCFPTISLTNLSISTFTSTYVIRPSIAITTYSCASTTNAPSNVMLLDCIRETPSYEL